MSVRKSFSWTSGLNFSMATSGKEKPDTITIKPTRFDWMRLLVSFCFCFFSPESFFWSCKMMTPISPRVLSKAPPPPPPLPPALPFKSLHYALLHRTRSVDRKCMFGVNRKRLNSTAHPQPPSLSPPLSHQNIFTLPFCAAFLFY